MRYMDSLLGSIVKELDHSQGLQAYRMSKLTSVLLK